MSEITDLAERVAQAEDLSFAADWLKKLTDEQMAPIFDGVRWTCRPVSREGEDQWTK